MFAEFISGEFKVNTLKGLVLGGAFGLLLGVKRPYKSMMFFAGVGAGQATSNLARDFTVLREAQNELL